MYTLINVHETHEDGTVSGTWLQDKCGDLTGAIDWARQTERLNSNKITIAVVARITGDTLGYHERMPRLTLNPA
jgi:hypothetical protein